MKLLAHVCCAHCAAQLVAGARAEFPGAEIALFWSNPNIHPLIEYRRRLKAVKMLAERLKMPLVLDQQPFRLVQTQSRHSLSTLHIKLNYQ